MDTKLLYIIWVQSRLDYASVVWTPYTKRNITRLEQIQRRATRFILGKEYLEHERLSELNLLPLQYRREILRNVDYLTLDVPFSRTETFKNSFFTRVCQSFVRNCLLNFTISSVLIFIVIILFLV